MSHVIEFLERMGEDARLRYATGPEIEDALAQAGLTPVMAAVLGDNRPLLEALTGAKPTLCAMVVAPEKEEEPEEEEKEDEIPGDDGDDDRKEV